MDEKLDRRQILKASASLATACGLASLSACGSSGTEATDPLPDPGLLPTRPFGGTGFDVTILGLGGQAALETSGSESTAETIIGRALDVGVNYFDSAASYGSGLSERNLGRTLGARRASIFLATKTAERTYDAAMRDLEQSLANLATDHVDLWQAHNIRTQQDLDAFLGSGGAYRAFQQALDEGTTRFVGITGHYDPDVLRTGFLSFGFDTALMALNAADVHEKSFIQGALPTAVERGLGVVAMKIPARGQIFRPGGLTTMEQALGYTLSHPVSTAIIGCSTVAEVDANAHIAASFQPLADAELRHLESLTASYYQTAGWFKTQG